MGRAYAEGLADTNLTIEQQVEIHLKANHYPPVPSEMVAPCVEAINLANQGDWGALIDLPEPITWRGEQQAPVSAIVEAHHLDPWISFYEE